MFSLVEYEDLNLLDGVDLRAVFDQVGMDRALNSLVGVSPAVRRQLLNKLPSSSATKYQDRLADHGPVSLADVRASQTEVVETLCRLGRTGQIAFNDPADMVA